MKNKPYITPMVELWRVYFDDLGENLPRWNGTVLYTYDGVFIWEGMWATSYDVAAM